VNFTRSTYGKKGQAGPTRGRQASTYRAQLPDGTVVTKRSFHIQTDKALLGCYQIRGEGKWFVSGVFSAPLEQSEQIFIEAIKL
jgi:hypothetical protein